VFNKIAIFKSFTNVDIIIVINKFILNNVKNSSTGIPVPESDTGFPLGQHVSFSPGNFRTHSAGTMGIM
jgi:hypothetical protein